ncbi:tetratricopeptide repeat protein [Anaerostipes butyraticus]|uniref:tetratricopeptide repeat protein n=1 Tax=Anaerostipes butyraticus TaxID=645466 RepID=UPI003207CB98
MIHLFKTKLKTLHKIILLGVIVILIICGWILFRHFRYQSYISAAEASEKEEQYVDAVIYYAMASHIKPKEETPYIKMADCYIDRSEMDQAMAILSVGEMQSTDLTQINKKLNEIQDFVDDDINVNTVEIPEYTSSAQLKRRSQVDAFIEEMRTYNGENGLDNNSVCFYKGYYYFMYPQTIYRTKENEADKETVYHRNEEYGSLSKMKIKNDRIFFVIYGHLHQNKVASVKLDGSDYTEYIDMDVFPITFFNIYKGSLNIYNYLSSNTSKIYTQINISDQKITSSEMPSGNYNTLGTLCFDPAEVYYWNDGKGIVKSNQSDVVSVKEGIEINASKSDTVVSFPQAELEHISNTNIYKYSNFLVYTIWTDQDDDSQTQVYDLIQEKKIDLNIPENMSLGCLNFKDDWIYYSYYKSDYYDTREDNESRVDTICRKNVYTDQIETLGQWSDLCCTDICNDKIAIIQDDDTSAEGETLKFIDLNTFTDNQS